MVQSASQLRGSPANYIYPSQDSTAYVPVISGLGGGSGIVSAFWSGAGENMKIRFNLAMQVAASGTADVSVSMPSGFPVDQAKLYVNNNVVGVGSYRNTSSQIMPLAVYVDSIGGAFYFRIGGTANLRGQDLNITGLLSFTVDIPIKGWSGKVPLLNVKTTSPILAGMVMAWPGATLPDGWGDADGAAVNIADYPDMYANIGTQYNTQINPTTGAAWAAPSVGQFRKPDYRGIMLKGVGTANGVTAVTQGGFQSDQNKSHNHGGYANIVEGSSVVSLGTYAAGGGGGYKTFSPAGSTILIAGNWSATIASDGGNEVVTRNKGVRWIVKLYNESFYPIAAPLGSANNAGFVQGGAIPGGNGSAPAAAGKVGQIIEAVTLTDQAGGVGTVTGTFYDITPLALPDLGIGEFDVEVSASLAASATAGSCYPLLYLRDANNNVLGKAIGIQNINILSQALSLKFVVPLRFDGTEAVNLRTLKVSMAVRQTSGTALTSPNVSMRIGTDYDLNGFIRARRRN